MPLKGGGSDQILTYSPTCHYRGMYLVRIKERKDKEKKKFQRSVLF